MSGLAYFFDLGNTRCKVWSCRAGVVEAYWVGMHSGDPGALLAQLPGDFLPPAERVLVASVLGERSDRAFADAVAARWGRRPEFARVGASFGEIRNAYRASPESLGVDRWLGLIGGAVECDVLCVVGCGTAITIDILDNNVHLGGYILPGLNLMAESLLRGTGRVRFEAASPDSIRPGTDTGQAVRNGGLAAVTALIEKTVSGNRVDRLVITGGDGPLVATALTIPCELDPELLLKGMMRFFDYKPGACNGGVSWQGRGQ